MVTWKLSLVIGWIGGIYGFLRGSLLAFQPLYATVTTAAPPPQPGGPNAPTPAPVPDTPPTFVYADPVLAAVIITVVLLVFGGALALLTLRQTEVFSVYAFMLLAFSLLSLPSIGWIFLPATLLLFLAAVLTWLPTSRGVRRE